MDAIKEFIEYGGTITIGPHLKRMEIDGVRDFHIRFVWEIKWSVGQTRSAKCKWEGFEDFDSMYQDLIKYLEHVAITIMKETQ